MCQSCGSCKSLLLFPFLKPQTLFMATKPARAANPSECNKPCSLTITSKAAWCPHRLVTPTLQLLQGHDSAPPPPPGAAQGFSCPSSLCFQVPQVGFSLCQCRQSHVLPAPAKAGMALLRPPDNASPVPKPWAGLMQGLLPRREPREAAPAQLPEGCVLCFKISLCKF